VATGSPITDRIAGVVPNALAWPLSAASTLVGLVGAGLILWAAATGSIASAIWSGICFVGAAGLWFLAEFAADEG
jgi:hypothetical protein